MATKKDIEEKAKRVVNALVGEADQGLGPEDEGGGDEGGNDFQPNDEAGFQAWLYDVIDSGAREANETCSVTTFEDAGILTRNKGLIVTTEHGCFQVTIVADNKHR